MIANSTTRPRPGPTGWPDPSVTVFLLAGLLIVLAAFGGESARVLLRYERTALTAGEWWRLLSGHFVHLGWSHTALNLLGIGLAAALFGRAYRAAEWLWVGACSLAAIDIAFIAWRPDLAWYVGFSGVLHGLFAAGALNWAASKEAEGYLLGLFLAAKLGWEQIYGALPLSVSGAGGPVVVDAHLAGAVGGLVAAIAVLLRDWAGSHR